MRGRWRFWFGLLLLNLSAADLSAQRPVELGFSGIATFAPTDLAVAGVYGAIRPTERVRLALNLGLGTATHATAFRAELLGHFLISPEARSGVAAYGLGGIALADAVFPGGRDGRGYLVLGLGLESRPGAGSGWVLEAGAGGGFRVSLGYRWRWFPGAQN